MDIFKKIAEDRIQEAQREGVFDNLPGKGKPLMLDDDSSIPEDLRLTFKILKNSDCLPIEMQLRKDIYNLRQLVDAAIDPETRQELRRELNSLVLHLNCLKR
ncbi:MAG TPA: DnaJ family domain-containing protein [Terriglobia bacterium]|nr:DnaJ family domain-containing protein [Terriglobia bacterium]